MEPSLAAKIAIVVCVVVTATTVRSCYIPEKDMIGSYISNDREPRAEFPDYGEKLHLLADGTYEAGSLGVGNWRMQGRELQMLEGKHGRIVGYYRSVRRRWIIGPPKIILNSDMGTFYEKVD